MENEERPDVKLKTPEIKTQEEMNVYVKKLEKWRTDFQDFTKKAKEDIKYYQSLISKINKQLKVAKKMNIELD